MVLKAMSKQDGDNNEHVLRTQTESSLIMDDVLKMETKVQAIESDELKEENDKREDVGNVLHAPDDTGFDDDLSMLIAMRKQKNKEQVQEMIVSDEPIKSNEKKLSFFSDSTTFVKEASVYPYTSTIVLIVFLHVIFFLQWKRRTVKKQVQFSYKMFIIQRKYHLMYWSYLSHVPMNAMDYNDVRGESERSPLLPTSTTPVTRASHTLRSRVQERFINTTSRMWRRLVRVIPLLHTIQTLKSLPQLTYISHLLWQIRILEEFMYRKDKSYIGLIMFAMISCTVFKSFLTWMILQLLQDRIGQGRRNSSQVSFTDIDSSQLLNVLGRGQVNEMGSSSFTSIICTLLVVYMNILPQVPLQILPFVPFFQLPANELGFMFCLLILLSFETRIGGTSRTGVWTGLINGLLIANGMDYFFVDNGIYWFHCIIGISCVMCIVSIWVDQRYRLGETNRSFRWSIPCIDYIGWDDEGITQELKDYESIWREGVMNGNEEISEDFNFNALVDADRISDDLETGEEGHFIFSDVNSNRGNNVTHRGMNHSRNDNFFENRRSL